MSKNNRHSVGRCFIICLGFSVVTILALSMLAAWATSMTADPTGKIPLFSLLVLILSAAVSGLFTSRQNPTEKIGFSLTVALGMTLLMLLIGIIISAGRLSGGAFMNYGCYFGIYSLLAYVGMRGKGRRKRKMRH